jgi:hypothetical protein
VTGLVDRLRSALDEAERIASAVILNDHEPWWTGDDLGAHVDEHDSAFIVANGPDVVLRTIQAHRSMIDWAQSRLPYADPILRGLAAIYLPDIETGDTE